MFRYVSSRIKEVIRLRHKHRHKYDNYDPVVKKVVDRLELLWEDKILLRATLKGLRKEEEDYDGNAAYLKAYGEAIEHLTTAVREFATTSGLIFEAEIGFYDEDSARQVLGSLIPELDAWHNLCIKVIDELKLDKGDPTNKFDSRGIIEAIHEVALKVTDKQREEKQTPTDPIFAKIEELMKKALLEKYGQIPNSESEFSKTLHDKVKDFHFDTLARELQDSTEPKKIPIIICGDFNSQPGRLDVAMISDVGKVQHPKRASDHIPTAARSNPI
ncbi:hypothetical protein CCACVL1_24980 [Corchorus capsularis]|uniref:Endonuclease/exonuclease/phosphatase n=1 Tax=Corchorus capsularis TaxID=210143 RepID=A0A1R3GMA7_COCAP|nr:hypothetical protein CCACVL1_24980 [Corchorus capsularis]